MPGRVVGSRTGGVALGRGGNTGETGGTADCQLLNSRLQPELLQSSSTGIKDDLFMDGLDMDNNICCRGCA